MSRDRSVCQPLARIRRRLDVGGDEGFTLVESMVAILIAGMVFSALGVSALSGVKAGVVARQNQQAADLANKAIEDIRSFDYAGLSNVTADVASDTCPVSGPDKGCVRPISGGGFEHQVNGVWEKVVEGNAGYVPTHITTVNAQGASYTVKRFITRPAATLVAGAPQYKRVSVVVSWSQYGKDHVRRAASAVTDTRRGLPLPKFSFGAPVTLQTNVGAYLAIPATLSNVGAPDAFNLSATAPPAGSGAWTWYFDNGPSLKAFDRPVSLGGSNPADTPVTSTDGDAAGLPDTNIVQPNTSVQLLLVRQVVAGEPVSQSVTLTATSAAQPLAATAVQSFTVQVGINPASCSGCGLITYLLHNGAVAGDTTTTTPLNMDVNAVRPVSALPNYSTEVAPSAAGRQVFAGGTATESNGSRVAVWYKQVPRATTLQGTASVRVWARTADGSATTMNAYIGSDQNSNQITGFSLGGSGTATLPATAPGTWQMVTFSVPITNAFSIGNTKYVAVRITTATKDVRLAYDTNTFPADATLPVTQGCPC